MPPVIDNKSFLNARYCDATHVILTAHLKASLSPSHTRRRGEGGNPSRVLTQGPTALTAAPLICSVTLQPAVIHEQIP